jgi:diguanylate cyclase (GGDEF)-like protein
VNDALGHGVGDVLLKSVAARIENLVRDGDIVARLGGDEFAVIAHDILDRETASGLAGRLVTALSDPFRIEGHDVQIGASVGVAMASKSDAEGNLLLKQADLAMYAAKEAGRNAYCLFEPNMQRSAEERRLVELGLRAAIVNDGFELLYQPIRELATDAIVGFECQVRWRHPLCGLLPPSHFLNVAAEIGIADAIGDWVIAEACRQAAMWPPNIVVGINLSSLLIGSGNLADRIEKALMATGLPPRRLELEIEISESSLLHADPEAIASLGRLKDMGVSIALDDFGTGYASLGYLVNFPFNRIKIDGMFVGELGRSKQSDLIVRSVAMLAKHLKCSVVAEGIETDEQRQRLRVLNVCHGQGPLLGKPMPAREVTALLLADSDEALAQSA